MATMAEPPEDLERLAPSLLPAELAPLRAAFFLERLPSDLASDVLDSPFLRNALAVGVQHPVTLAPDVASVDREVLFKAFRKATSGEAVDHLTTVDGARLDAAIVADPSTGRGQVTLGRLRVSIPDIDLLAVHGEARAAASDRVTNLYTLTAAETEALRSQLALGPLTDEAFTEAVAIIAATPERFAAAFRAALEEGALSVFDLLPEEAGYWDRLVPPPEDTTTLAAYIGGPLRARRQAWLGSNPASALRRMALEFAAPALVPHELIDAVAQLREVLRPLADTDDHFSLVGVIEICARRLKEVPELGEVCTAALERLGAPDDRLGSRAAAFAAVFVLASARLARHDSLRERPAFWRRLAAAAHASLVVRTAGIDEIDADKLLAWAADRGGTTYLLSGLLDRRTSPRWRPEWVDKKHLVGDAVGRVRQAVLGVADDVRPVAWRGYLDGLDRWLEEAGTNFLSVLPAVLEGDVDPPSPEALPEVLRSAVDAFVAQPSAEQIPALAGIVFTHGLPDEAAPVLRSFLENGSAMAMVEDRVRELAFLVGAHAGVERRDEVLADAVAEAAVHALLAGGVDASDRVRPALFLIVECTGAYRDIRTSDDRLVNRLERIAFAPVGDNVLVALATILASLKRVRPSLLTRLGRSLAATAKAGVPQR